MLNSQRISPRHLSNLAKSLLVLTACALNLPVFAQLQWSSYTSAGALISNNVATGGDATYGGTVNLTIPASTEYIFMARSFAPVVLATPSSAIKVDFSMNATGGLYPGSTGRIFGMGLFSDPATPATVTDDPGFWTDFNTGNPGFELFYRPTNATIFSYNSTYKLSTGNVKTGYPTNGITYGMQFQLNLNSPASGVSIGTSTSTFGTSGAAMTNGNGAVNELAYSSAEALTTFADTNYNEFGFMFNNTSASAVIVTLSGITLVPANPVITAQPLGYSGSPGDSTPTTDFSVTLNTNSATPLTIHWFEVSAMATNQLTDGVTGNGSTISGSTTINLTFSNAQVADSASYFVVITNAYGSVTSSPAILNIASSAMAPVISSIAPATATIIAGNGTNVIVSATGAPSPVYFWYDSNTNLLQAGASATLTLSNVQPGGAGTYSVIASNSAGSASTNFTINVIVTPTISIQPASVLLNPGNTANFSVTASGTPAPGYQWYKNNAAISGATNPSFSIPSLVYSDIGNYYVVVTNAAGSVNSSNAVLAINSSITAAPLMPSNNATGVCYDTPLYLTFPSPVFVGNTGKVRIYNATNSSTPVDTLNLAANNSLGVQMRSSFSGDSQVFNYYPVIVTGNTAAIYPHSGVLTSNQTYYVTIDAGVLTDTNGAYYTGFSASNVWSFTTKLTGPANATNLVVTPDYSGDFATVQGAVDSIPPGNTTPSLINLKNGNYVEIVNISAKNNITLRGQSRSGTLVGYPNNGLIANGGSSHSRMAFKVNANDISLDNLTISNSTPQDASQAEALMLETAAARLIVNNCTLASYQDTFLANTSTSKAYVNNSLIQGDVDFIWGGGNLFFTNCEARWLIRSNNTAALGPNPSPSAGDISSNGFSFINCRLTTLPGANPADTVGRTRGLTNGNTALITCLVSTNIGGWFSDAVPTNNFRNWYYACTNDFNAGVTLSNGIALSATDVNVTNASSATIWLYGWQPQLAPNILTNPISQTVNYSSNVTFVVVATGVPDPTYQWLLNGTNISGATNAILIITNITSVNAGSYTVVVTTSAGSVTSAAATLTVNPPANTPPVFLAPVAGTNFTLNVGVNFSASCTATDYDMPPQTLTYMLLTGPLGASVDSTNGSLTWRPTVSQQNSVNPVQVIVTDNGSPNLSATNSFTLTVNPLTAPTISSPSYSGNQFSVSISGQVGPDYELQTTTNIPNGVWISVAVTNSPVTMPVIITDTNAGSLPMKFYRIVTGPPVP